MRTSTPTLPKLSAVLAAALALAILALAPVAQAAPKRIAALTPFSANTLASLGVKPVGIGETLGGQERFSSKLKGAEKLTLSHPNGPNMEELALLNPSLVFSSPTWNKGASTMRDLGIRVVNTDPGSVASVFSQTVAIGKLVGRKAQAEKVAKRLKKQVARARKGIKKRPRTLVVLGVGRTPFVLLPNSWGGDVVRKAGGRLVTAGAKGNGFVRVSDEAILEANPEVIIAIPHGNASDMDDIAKFLRTNPAWKGSKAVRRNRLYLSGDNSLLQAGTDVARTIRKVRRAYLKN
jgi:iron complex transport system substrate-binding protein